MNIPEVKDKIGTFLRHIREVLKKSYPNELVTVGFATLDYCKEFEAVADVLTYHVTCWRTIRTKNRSMKHLRLGEKLINQSSSPRRWPTLLLCHLRLRRWRLTTGNS